MDGDREGVLSDKDQWNLTRRLVSHKAVIHTRPACCAAGRRVLFRVFSCEKKRQNSIQHKRQKVGTLAKVVEVMRRKRREPTCSARLAAVQVHLVRVGACIGEKRRRLVSTEGTTRRIIRAVVGSRSTCQGCTRSSHGSGWRMAGWTRRSQFRNRASLRVMYGMRMRVRVVGKRHDGTEAKAKQEGHGSTHESRLRCLSRSTLVVASLGRLRA